MGFYGRRSMNLGLRPWRNWAQWKSITRRNMPASCLVFMAKIDQDMRLACDGRAVPCHESGMRLFDLSFAPSKETPRASKTLGRSPHVPWHTQTLALPPRVLAFLVPRGVPSCFEFAYADGSPVRSVNVWDFPETLHFGIPKSSRTMAAARDGQREWFCSSGNNWLAAAEGSLLIDSSIRACSISLQHYRCRGDGWTR